MRLTLILSMIISGACIANAEVIENKNLHFTLDYDTGLFQLTAKASGLPGCTGSLESVADVTVAGSDALIAMTDAFVYKFSLPPQSIFLVVSVTRAADPPAQSGASLNTPEFLVDFKASLDTVQILGCDGLEVGNKEREGYTFLAASCAKGEGGVVAGWLTQNRASGIILSHEEEGKLALQGRAEYGKSRHIPSHGQEAEHFAIGLFADPLLGLEAYGAAIAKANDIVLDKPIPSGYCTWYSKPYGGACNRRRLIELTDFCQTTLHPYGFQLVQIDDMWQAGRKRPKEFTGPRLGFLEHNRRGPYRKGMEEVAPYIQNTGMTAGLWFIPFAADPENEPAASHPEWFVKTAAGDPYFVFWAGWSLDMTHPGAVDYVTQVVHRITKEWDFGYIKIDGLWSGMATTCLYPTPDYREDDLGGAVFNNSKKTNIEAYRDGLAVVRQAAGDDVFILGCNIAQNMRTLGASIGLVDGMRVGRDIAADWDNILPCAEMGARLYFLHNRVWYNDPDCLMLREPLTLDQARAWASWIAVSGQMNLVSEWLPGLPEERLDLVKRSMPNHSMNARPLDLFEQAIPRVWLLTDKENSDRHTVAFFNWDKDAPAKVILSLDKIGNGSFSGFEYWGNAVLAPTTGSLEVTVAPSACQVFSLRPTRAVPCVIGTSRHITQGMIDLSSEQWDPASRTLSGTSQVVGGDPYEIRILLPEGNKYSAITRTASDAGTLSVLSLHDSLARVLLESKESATLSWQVTF